MDRRASCSQAEDSTGAGRFVHFKLPLADGLKIGNFKRMKYAVLILFFLIYFSIACQELPPTRKIVSSSLPVKQLWQTQLKEPSSASPILTNRVIIAQTSVALYGLDKDSGQQLWKHTFNSRQLTPAPIIAQGNLVFLGDNDGMVTALDTVSGEVNWQRQHCGKESGYYTIESIVTDQERVYVASQPTAIEAIYLDNGSISWNHCPNK